MRLVLCLLFLASGASALVFETLWFHEARLVLGSSVWASSLVPAGFMAGLGLGSIIAMRRGDSLSSPLRTYAALEMVVAVSGVALVNVLPGLEGALAPVFRPFLDHTSTLIALRLAVAFVLLLVPSTAMGLTLPVLTRWLTAHATFGRALGQLYGWNTLGAVIGTIWAEASGIVWLGIHHTALVAAALNLTAASGALLLSRRTATPAPLPTTRRDGATRVWRWLLVASMSGAALLALEVIWFRFLALYVITGSLAFALMLAIVLGGIALGSFAGSRFLHHVRSKHTFCGAAALAAGVLTVACYATSHFVVVHAHIYVVRSALPLLELGVPLMLPVATVSGALFTLTGSALRESTGHDAETVGLLTLFNTVGAALGALLAGFVLLPALGMERSFFVVALVYGAVACIALTSRSERAVRPNAALGAAYVLCVVLFPFGSMRSHFATLLERWAIDPQANVQVREGLTETIFYVEKRFAGRNRCYQLLTNAISMASSDFRNRRYMKLFAYLPVAIHPKPRSALLVSFGVGATAKALTDTRELERIDVVDVSRDILEMSHVVYADADNPLNDPRVHVHVEDGRFFLQTTGHRFDIITAEPPPPGVAGVVDLYTREYFRLLYGRLSEGGVATYWLPTHSMTEQNSLSVIRAFCDVFEDCSLWNGIGQDLMLVGTRNAPGPVSEARFQAQWDEPRLASELNALGFESPQQLATLFVADAGDLAQLTREALPVVDDFPARIVPPPAYVGYEENAPGLYGAWANAQHSKSRFETSALVARLLPPEVRARSQGGFEAQDIINRVGYLVPSDLSQRMKMVHAIMTTTSLRAPIAWILGSDSDVERILGELSPTEREQPEIAFHVGVQKLAARHLEDALRPLELAESVPSDAELAMYVRAYVLASLGRASEANLVEEQIAGRFREVQGTRYLAWMKQTFP